MPEEGVRDGAVLPELRSPACDRRELSESGDDQGVANRAGTGGSGYRVRDHRFDGNFCASAPRRGGCSTSTTPHRPEIGVPTPRTDTAPANPQQRPSATTPITDAQIATAIQGSDDFGLHQAAFISGSRQFLARGGTIGDLREMGGWVRSQSHKPRRVYFTYRRPGTHISHRWYFDIDSGGLFQ